MKQTYDSLSVVAGANLKRLIKEQYQTQERFAEAYNTDARCVRRWISNGLTKTEQIEEIARFFDINPLEMFKPVD